MPGSAWNRTAPSRKSNTPRRAGAEPAGRTMPFDGSVPTRVSPGFSQNSPDTVSHPSSALSVASWSPRHWRISAS